MTVTIYHNPRCSKSRATLAILQDQGVEHTVIRYLETPPSAGELDRVLTYLGLEPRELIRKGEPEYREQGLDNPALSRTELIAAMVKTPKLIERPVVIKDDKATIGRPPESILNIL